MNGKFNFKIGALCAILSAMLLIPAWPGQRRFWSEMHKMRRARRFKELKLSPEKGQGL